MKTTASTSGKPQPFELVCHGDEQPVLTGVQAHGQLDGVLYALTLRQTYRNTSQAVLEVVYSFPLAHQAVLLGFASELNGVRQVGSVVPKPAAERQYEKALAQGDAPVMLECGVDGVHTANIGNLKPGDELTLEVRLAQLLRFEHGRLRLSLPGTIAPRYGNALRAGLQPQQVPQASLTAAYPLCVTMTISGDLATADVDCPTHRFTRKMQDSALQLDLDRQAWLDRDVVVTVTPREPRQSLALRAADTVPGAAATVVMAALQPPLSAPREHVALKLLVDCSGSMAGDSIASARAALVGVANGLQANDQVSLSRFGSTVEHGLAAGACKPDHLSQLRGAISRIEADLGGTEMAAALSAVFGLAMTRDRFGSDVLLVTDGEVWGAEALAEAARNSGHRVFAIGVGSSPAETVLRTLAEATGGACEFATPGEALEAAAGRMLARIRQQPWREARVDWGCETVWQSPLPRSVFGGDTAVVFAGVADAGARPTIRLLAADAGGRSHELARAGAEETVAGDTLPRMAAHGRLAQVDSAQATGLAVSYQLLTEHTNCILVHERAEADKPVTAAELHQVPSMMAGGWAASSSVVPRGRMLELAAHSAAPRPVLAALRPVLPDLDTTISLACRMPVDDMEAFGGPYRGPEEESFASLNDMVTAAMAHLSRTGALSGLAAHGESLKLHHLAREALDKALWLGCTPDEAWLVLVHWVAGEALDPTTTALLERLISTLDPAKVVQARAEIAQCLDGQDRDLWTVSREERLRKAMGV